MNDITVFELKERMDQGSVPPIFDVRETWEYETDHIDCVNIPLGELPTQTDKLAHLKDEEFIVCCRSGGRSGRAAAWLRANGWNKVRNLEGGMLAWKANINPSFNVE